MSLPRQIRRGCGRPINPFLLEKRLNGERSNLQRQGDCFVGKNRLFAMTSVKINWSEDSDQIHFNNRRASGADKRVVRQNYHMPIIHWKINRGAVWFPGLAFNFVKHSLTQDFCGIGISSLRPNALKLLDIESGNFRVIDDEHIFVVAFFGVGRVV
jgi:hypothetical protein